MERCGVIVPANDDASKSIRLIRHASKQTRELSGLGLATSRRKSALHRKQIMSPINTSAINKTFTQSLPCRAHHAARQVLVTMPRFDIAVFIHIHGGREIACSKSLSVPSSLQPCIRRRANLRLGLDSLQCLAFPEGWPKSEHLHAGPNISEATVGQMMVSTYVARRDAFAEMSALTRRVTRRVGADIAAKATLLATHVDTTTLPAKALDTFGLKWRCSDLGQPS